MVLVAEGKRHVGSAEIDLVDELCSTASLKQAADQLKLDVRQVESGSDLLYIHQDEMCILKWEAGTSDSQSPRFLASDDATSCHIVLLRSQEICAFAHLSTSESVCSFFDQVRPHFEATEKVIVQVVGGFLDDREISLDITLTLIRCLVDDAGPEYEIKLFCCGELNTTLRHCDRQGKQINFPIVTGILYDTQTDAICSARVAWKARGPLAPLRLSRTFSDTEDSRPKLVFSPDRNCLIIEPFGRYHPNSIINPKHLTQGTMYFFSTTPDQEPETFYQGMRATLQLMFHNPDPMQSWFADGPLSFVLQPDGWTGVDRASKKACESRWNTVITGS